MTTPGSDTDVTRRTWLAAERTWLAWWRTGIAVGAVAVAIGRVIPGLSGGRHWPYRVLGIGYGALSVAILLIGAYRQRRSADALRRGAFVELASPLVNGLTAVGIALSIGAMIVVISGL
jgi:putative membrane protein